ncbi:hypothetical protein J6590_060774 [Homalodisca vitripennis]|nr:hypothetical protein J6590_060774 [Homalodisca vitripennis]
MISDKRYCSSTEGNERRTSLEMYPPRYRAIHSTLEISRATLLFSTQFPVIAAQIAALTGEITSEKISGKGTVMDPLPYVYLQQCLMIKKLLYLKKEARNYCVGYWHSFTNEK